MNAFSLGNGQKHLALNADAQIALAVCDDSTIRVIDIAAGSIRCNLAGHNAKVIRAGISADGSRAFSFSEGGKICLWKLSDGSLAGSIFSATGQIAGIAISPDGQAILLIDRSGIARIYNQNDCVEEFSIDILSFLREDALNILRETAEDPRYILKGQTIKSAIMRDRSILISISYEAGIRGQRKYPDIFEMGFNRNPSVTDTSIYANLFGNLGGYSNYWVDKFSADGSRALIHGFHIFPGGPNFGCVVPFNISDKKWSSCGSESLFVPHSSFSCDARFFVALYPLEAPHTRDNKEVFHVHCGIKGEKLNRIQLPDGVRVRDVDGFGLSSKSGRIVFAHSSSNDSGLTYESLIALSK